MSQQNPQELATANALFATPAYQRSFRYGCPECGRPTTYFRFPPGKPEELFFTCPAGHHWKPAVTEPED